VAEGVARAARYHPDGHRGMAAGGRAHDYGVGTTRDESTRWVNSQLLVIPMVEETEAVNNLDAILKVSGVDVLHVASSDLGQSMGNPGAAAVRQVMRAVIPRIRAGGKLVGVGGNSPSDAAGIAEFIKLGANFVTISSLGLLRLGAEDFRKRVQAAL
jgi:4-hydroxy-2-oxoheptanedioate aldolase